MLIWIIIFILIVVVSFILAWKSMSDYHEQPFKLSAAYSLFLVNKEEALTPEIINKLHQDASSEKLILSFERLFKGARKALVIFGPITLLRPLVPVLDLVELEDYSRKIGNQELDNESSLLAWEVGRKTTETQLIKKISFSSFTSLFNESEEFWWQVTTQPITKGFEEKVKILMGGVKRENNNPLFEVTVRAVLQAKGKETGRKLQTDLSKIGSESGLAALPQVYSSSQILKFYQERTLPNLLSKTKTGALFLTADEINSLVS